MRNREGRPIGLPQRVDESNQDNLWNCQEGRLIESLLDAGDRAWRRADQETAVVEWAAAALTAHMEKQGAKTDSMRARLHGLLRFANSRLPASLQVGEGSELVPTD